MNPKELIQHFITERLNGDINNFVSYDLAQLEGDKVFGCPGRSFDCDDSNVARAVYCLPHNRQYDTAAKQKDNAEY